MSTEQNQRRDGEDGGLGGGATARQSKVTRLLTYWNDMATEDKEQAVGIAIATVATAVTAIVALRSKKKTPLKTAGKKLVRAVAKKVG